MRRAGTALICAAAWFPTIRGATATSTGLPASARLTKSSRSDPTGRKAAVERQPTLRAARAELSVRRPREGGDPYAVRSRLGIAADPLRYKRHRRLWVPAFAGTTNERGFALIEILCVLAIIGLLAAIILPAVPRATSRARLESYAVETAALLKADRPAALRRQVPGVTEVDAQAGPIRSGLTRRGVP